MKVIIKTTDMFTVMKNNAKGELIEDKSFNTLRSAIRRAEYLKEKGNDWVEINEDGVTVWDASEGLFEEFYSKYPKLLQTK